MNATQVDEFVGLPRWRGMALSHDGARLVGVVDHLGKDDRYRSELCELDPFAVKPPRTLFESAGRISALCFARGDLYLVDDRELVVLETSGRRRRLGPGDAIESLVPTADGTRIIVVGSASQGASLGGAALHRNTPILNDDSERVRHPTLSILENGTLRRIPVAGTGLMAELGFFPDRSGRRVLANQRRAAEHGEFRIDLVLIETDTGKITVLHQEDDVRLLAGPFAPAGTSAAVQAMRLTAGLSERRSLAIVDTTTGNVNPLAENWDRWGKPEGWLPGGQHLLVSADEAGSSPLFLVSVNSSGVMRLTDDDCAYEQPIVHPTEEVAFAVRATIRVPAESVRLDICVAPQQPRPLGLPATQPEFAGTVTDLWIPARDGVEIHGRLMLPPTATEDNPAPLVVWPHGGPAVSWAGWRWARSPWPLVARGTAVLMPDIAMSTGYGQAFIDRGWGDWGGAPFRDLLDVTRAVTARPDINAGKVAVVGTSYGGYLASWAAANSDDFHAAVAHAPPWDLEQFQTVTDDPARFRRRMDAGIRRGHSPRWQVNNIRIPMLVSQGGRDTCVPREQALAQWRDLLAQSRLAMDGEGHSAHRFLYLPYEGHRISSVQATRAWYHALLTFLDTHLHGRPERYPSELTAEHDGELA
ncbi:alpha/beta fold hydrolase [Streptomyces antimycoticus]